ncbi:MAG: Rrf2 family transcriptional regulator [Candidatus Tenebribacter burtonii]|jgi:Rrf2 family protein|nr:Rrf2 family transcriptional regulator [Candidatus Tenebribacter burtonii]
MSNLINISEAASLALHGLVVIAKSQPSRINVKVLAEKLNASQTHMAKVFQKLGKANLVRSLRGPAGGFELNKQAGDITFLEIYEIIDGEIILGDCPLGKNHCVFKSCIFDNELTRISTEIYEAFSKIKLSDF